MSAFKDLVLMRRRASPYLAAPVCILAATLLRLALQPLSGDSIPFATYFAVALIFAWRFGFGPAAFVVGLSVVVGGHYILPSSPGEFLPSSTAGRAAMLGFALISLGVSFLLDVQRRTLRRARAAEREQVRANQELTRINQDLEAFAFAASHDLREPLRNISVFSQLLIEATRHGREQQAEDAARFIVEGTERMNWQLNDLLMYTQLSTGENEAPEERVDLNAVVATTLRNLQTLIEQTNARVTYATLPAARGREVHFLQLFQNLIDNAIKYRSGLPPRIHISASRTGAEWRCAVADNGIGVEPPYREHIFGLFKRLHSARIPGTGLGLAICRRIVARSGGRIWVESTPKGGSVFYFTLPVDEGGVPKPAPESGAMQVARSQPG